MKMIIIKNCISAKKLEINELNFEVLTLFQTLGRFEYSVDFNKNTIIVNVIDNVSIRNLGKFTIFYNHLLENVIYNYKVNKNISPSEIYISGLSIPSYFLDEIQFIGIMYIENIVILPKDKMKSLATNSIKLYNDLDIINDYNRITKDDSENPLPIINKENDFQDSNFPWWKDKTLREDNQNSIDDILRTGPISRVNSEPTFISLLGLFVKSRHTVYLCEENIETTRQKLERYDDWFNASNFDEFVRLVLLHEIGHSIFQYSTSKRPIFNETKANYYSSFATNGIFDEHIYVLTRFQPFIYRFPYLSFSFQLTKNYYRRGMGHSNLLRNYNKQVGKIYEL